jgi:chromosome segregation ATPase
MKNTESSALSTRTGSVTEAASHFGISTLRVRHRLHAGSLKGFRDNRGHWQVYLDGASTPEPDRPLDGDALTDLLVEELVEANDRIDEQEAAIKRLQDIVERQQKILDRTIVRLEMRLTSQTDGQAADRVRKVLDRLLALLETSVAQHEAAKAEAERFRAMTARAMEMLESVEPRARAAVLRSVKLSDKLAAAVDLGDRAVERAEMSTGHATQLDNMLERALAVAEQNFEHQRMTERRLKSRDQLLERSLNLMEEAVSRVGVRNVVRRSWFALLGWRGQRSSDE